MNRTKQKWSEFKFGSPPESSTETLPPNAPWKLTLDVAGRGELKTDLSYIRPFGRLGETIRDTLFILLSYAASRGAVASIYAHRTAAWAILRYLTYCKKEKLITEFSPSQITTSILSGYASWLVSPLATFRRKGLSLSCEFSRGIRLIRNTAQIFPTEFPSDFEHVANPFSHRKLVSDKGDSSVLSEKNFNTIKSRAKELVAARISMAPASVPKRDDLWPFLFYIMLETTGNAVPITELTRKCLTQHAIESDYQILNWDKRRNGATQHHPIHIEEKPFSLVTVINYLIEWTAPLVARAKPQIRNRLFLYETYKATVGVLRSNMVLGRRGAHMKPSAWFSSTYNTPPFRLRQLRETEALLLFFSGKSILDIQELLQHGSLESTRTYLMSRAARIERDERMSVAQEKIARSLRPASQEVIDLPLEDAVRRLTASREAKQRIIRGEYEVGLNGCKNPWRSPFMKEKGKLCSYHRACLDCENAFYVREHLPALIAELRVLLKKRATMSEADWFAGPASTVQKLSTKIGQFSKNSIQQAEADADVAETLVLANLKTHIIHR